MNGEPVKTVDIRAKLTVRNDALISAREKLGLTQKQAAEMADVPLGALACLEKFDFSKFAQDLQQYAEKLAGCFDIPLPKIFADGLAGKKIESTIVRHVQCDPQQLESISQSGRELQGVPLKLETPINTEVINNELASKIDRLLKTLTYREREILKLRYGLDQNNGYGEVYTLEETARIFKVTRERIRQTEEKAIRKLQHPVRAAKLESFLPDHDECEDLIIAAGVHESAGDFKKSLVLLKRAATHLRPDDPNNDRIDGFIQQIKKKMKSISAEIDSSPTADMPIYPV